MKKQNLSKALNPFSGGFINGFLTFCIMLGFGFTGLQAQNEVLPANFYNLVNGEPTNEITVAPGETFTWIIGMSSEGGMDGVTITSEFDTNLLQEDDETITDLIGANLIFGVQSIVNNETGYITFTKTAIGTSITGSFDVMELVFTVNADAPNGTTVLAHELDPAVVLRSNIVYIGNEILADEDAPSLIVNIQGPADCPELGLNIGDACDDGDETTENDVVGDDCNCAGTPIFVCEADGGAIEFGDGSSSVTVCVDDNEPSTVDVGFSVAPTAPDGYGATWVITETDGTVLGFPATMADVENIDFDDAGAGNCLIWFLSFEADNSNADEAAGAFEPGNGLNASDLTGCFDLSNSIEVVRENCGPVFDCPALEANIGDACDDGNEMTENDVVTADCECVGTPVFVCEADGGSIEFGDGSSSVTVCVDDDEPSTVDVGFSVAPTAPDGYGATWVITETDGTVLGFPATMADVENIDFDDAGAGNCLIWFLSFEADNSNADEAAGAFEPGNGLNASDLTGCFDLSNSIEVVRENCDPGFDCPDLEANIGDACDDGNAMTENDTVGTDCQCVGTPIVFDCPDLEANFGDACNDGNDETGNDMINENCECEGTPIVVPDCNNFMYYLADHAAADGISDIYGVTLSAGVATMSYIATSEIEVHIAFNEEDNLIYALSKFENSYRTLDPSTGIWGPTVMLGADYGEVTAAVFNADAKLVFGSQDNNAIYCVNVTTNVVSDYDTAAPVTGGDLAFASDGMLYLATRSGLGSLYEVYPDDVMPDVLIGSVPELVTGMAITDAGNQLLVSAQGNMSLDVYNTDGSSAGVSYMLDLDGEPYTLRDGDMASGCNTSNTEEVCDDFTTFYVNHGPEIEGSDLYTVDFSGGMADMTLVTNVPFEAHISFNAASNILYFVNANGDFVRLYDVTNDVFMGDLPLIGDFTKITAVIYNPADGFLYVGEDIADEVYTVDLGTGVATFYADAPVSGGDLAILDGGEIYLASREGSELYEVNQGGAATLVGGIGVDVTGMSRANDVSTLMLSNKGAQVFTRINSADASVFTTYAAMLGGMPFTLSNGDMAAGCADEAEEEEPVVLEGLQEQSQLTTYPNPTSGPSQVVFMTGETGRTLVEVYDMNGRNVTTLFNQEAQKGQEYRLDFDGTYLPNGVYIYRLTNNNETIIEKFMIAK